MASIDAYIIIANPLKESARIKRLEKHLLERGIDSGKIHYCAPTWSDTLTTEQIFKYYDPYPVRPAPCFTYKGHCLTKGEISLVLNFWAAAELAISLGTKRVIIFESDVMLREDFLKRLEKALENCSQWDYVSLSDGVGTHAPRANNSFYAESVLLPAPHQFCFRTTDSMLFKTDFLKRIRRTAFPFRECLDWELNYQNMINGGRAFWIEPHIVEQQTMKGILTTSLAG
jgi:GR25 family glycosyltransferase involved in LPS biosynthesis